MALLSLNMFFQCFSFYRFEAGELQRIKSIDEDDDLASLRQVCQFILIFFLNKK